MTCQRQDTESLSAEHGLEGLPDAMAAFIWNIARMTPVTTVARIKS